MVWGSSRGCLSVAYAAPMPNPLLLWSGYKEGLSNDDFVDLRADT